MTLSSLSCGVRRGGKPLTINLNARIRVRLTIEGRNVYHDHWSDLVRYAGNLTEPPLIDEDIWEGELWDFAHIFGRHLYNGCPPLTVGTNLTVVSPD